MSSAAPPADPVASLTNILEERKFGKNKNLLMKNPKGTRAFINKVMFIIMY
jgi:hypothetical protein